MISNSSLHCRGDAQGLVNPAHLQFSGTVGAPLPNPVAFPANLGPSAGHSASNPVSPHLPSRFRPFHCGQSSAKTKVAVVEMKQIETRPIDLIICLIVFPRPPRVVSLGLRLSTMLIPSLRFNGESFDSIDRSVKTRASMSWILSGRRREGNAVFRSFRHSDAKPSTLKESEK